MNSNGEKPKDGELFAELNHEIRTPMSGVIGLAHLLSETDLSEVQREYVGAIRSCADSLLTVMNDIIDFSQIQAGQMAILHQPFDLRETVDLVWRSLSHKAEESNLYFRLEVDGEVPNRLCGDPGRIRQILHNLIGNAIKFTLEGGITVRIDACPSTHERARFLVSVQDTGPGLSAELFDGRSEGAVNRRFAGAGLGLTISQKLVDMMEGQMGLSTEEGVGNCFWFELELPTAEELKRTDPVAIPLDQTMAGTRILIAEDDPINRLVAIRYLEKLGCDLTICVNGRQALETLKTHPADLILMDCEMPELNGYQTTEMIRIQERGKGGHIPIIAMTANAMIGDRERCLEAGMDDYLSKPVKPEDLLSILHRFRASSQMAA